ERFILRNKRRQPHRNMRLVRQPATHAQAVPNFLFSVVFLSLQRRQRHIINLRERAPHRASAHGNLELPRQVIKLRIPRQLLRHLHRQRRRINQLMPIQSRQRAPRHIPHHIAARALRSQPDLLQLLRHHRQRLNRQPVQLNILPRRHIPNPARILRRNIRNPAHLPRRQQPIRQRNPLHEELRRLTLAARPSGHAQAIALRINPPPPEVRRPLRRNATVSQPRKLPHLIPRIPRILLALQPLGLLGFRFFHGYSLFDWRSLFHFRCRRYRLQNTRLAHVKSPEKSRKNEKPTIFVVGPQG